jgi:hypothetical protein
MITMILKESQTIADVFPARSAEPSLQERWKSLETWIQTSAPEKLRTAYNQIEVGQVQVVSDEEAEQIKHYYTTRNND